MKTALPGFLAVVGFAIAANAQLSTAPRRLRALQVEPEAVGDLDSGTALPLLLSMGNDANFVIAGGAMDDGSGKSGKGSGKSGKGSGKSGKGSSNDKCDQDDFLVERYGKQLCSSQIENLFTKIEESACIVTDGLQNFNAPDFSGPTVDTFQTYGRIALIREQAESVCVTMCENNPACAAVQVYSPVIVEKGGKPIYFCTMVNPELGPGAYLELDSEDRKEDVNPVVFLKKSADVEIPPLVPCDVDGANIGTSVYCQLNLVYGVTPPTGLDIPAICDPLLTDDYVAYIAPAITCLAENDAIAGCLECLLGEGGAFAKDICPIGDDDEDTFIRGACKAQCIDALPLQTSCEGEIQTALLCANGAPFALRDTGDRFYYGGQFNGPLYTCPI